MMNMHIFAPETSDIHAARIFYGFDTSALSPTPGARHDAMAATAAADNASRLLSGRRLGGAERHANGNRTREEAQRHRQNNSRLDPNSTFSIAHAAQYRVPDLRKGHPPWAYDTWSAGADVFSRLVTGFRILDPLSSHLKECTRSEKGVQAEATAWRKFALTAEHRLQRRRHAFESRRYRCIMGAYLRDEKAR